jgi:phosphoesterase RecJ-like protein
LLVVTHKRADGDAVGSLLGLGLSLEQVGKQVYMVVEGGVPDQFSFLTGAEKVHRKPAGDRNWEVIVVVDSSDLARTGDILKGYRAPDVNIDHHHDNSHFARLNLVDARAAATAEVLVGLLLAWGLPVHKETAEALLVGMLADTIGFSTNNMSPQVLRMAAALMELGADLPRLYRCTLLQRSFSALRYWGAGLSTLQREDGMAWATLTLQDRSRVRYLGGDDADLINLLGSIGDVEVYLVFVEQEGGVIKVSWRAKTDLDVSAVAHQFGGGGHRAAAGAELRGMLAEVQAKVLTATKALFVR